MASKSGRYVRDKLGRFASTGSSGAPTQGGKTYEQMHGEPTRARNGLVVQGGTGGLNSPGTRYRSADEVRRERANFNRNAKTQALFAQGVDVSNRSGMSKTQFSKLKAKYKFR